MRTSAVIKPDGSVRMIYRDDLRPVIEKVMPASVPRRASHVEPIQDGPCAGMWFADMSPLGGSFQYCLWPPRQVRAEALADETRHIEKHWLGIG